jgi:hypothetical protein
MVQWISTKLGTQVIVTKLWHPIDFLGQRSRSQLNFEFFRGVTARGYATLCVALIITLKMSRLSRDVEDMHFSRQM